MRTTVMMAMLGLMAACSTQPTYQDPAPTAAARGAATYPGPCDRDDFPLGPAGDAEYTNCVIQN